MGLWLLRPSIVIDKSIKFSDLQQVMSNKCTNLIETVIELFLFFSYLTLNNYYYHTIYSLIII